MYPFVHIDVNYIGNRLNGKTCLNALFIFILGL